MPHEQYFEKVLLSILKGVSFDFDQNIPSFSDIPGGIKEHMMVILFSISDNNYKMRLWLDYSVQSAIQFT